MVQSAKGRPSYRYVRVARKSTYTVVERTHVASAKNLASPQVVINQCKHLFSYPVFTSQVALPEVCLAYLLMYSMVDFSGVTRGLSQGGQSLAEGGPLVTVGGPTRQSAEKKIEIIVNLWMSWMSIQAKKSITTRKRKKNNLKNTKYQNVN